MMVYFLQSLLLRTITRPPTCKTAHRMPVWLIERLRTILVISNVFWEVHHLETMLKLSYNLSKKRIYPCSFLKFCNYAWIMRLLTNYAKSCNLRSIMRNRNIAEYQKPWKGGNQILQQHIGEIPANSNRKGHQQLGYLYLECVWLKMKSCHMQQEASKGAGVA